MIGYDECVLPLSARGHSLLAIASIPAIAASDLGVVIVVGGPQYRVGSHRQFVHLARSLAASGIPALRFDLAGMGDSCGEPRCFDDVADDIAAAASTLQRAVPAVRRIVLWGLCDGASAALIAAYSVGMPPAALVLLNPWVRAETTLARMQVKHYYSKRVMQREFWRKLLRGRVGIAAVRELASKLATVARPTRDPSKVPSSSGRYQDRMAEAWRSFRGPILLVLSGDDYTAKEFIELASTDPLWQGLLAGPGVTRLSIEPADHTFSNSRDARALESATIEWLRSVATM